MNGPSDLPLTHSSGTPDPKNCSLVSIIPIVGMSSCRGRAAAFARRLSSKLRTLGPQDDTVDLTQEDESIKNGGNTNTWVTSESEEISVTDLQPLRHESDSFFDFDCELESPGSPIDECEYLRLIESSSNTPHNSAAESGYACASAASSHSSSDGPYFDVNSEKEASTTHLQHPLQRQQQPQNQQQTSKRLSQPLKQAAKDEVDFSVPERTRTDQYNGHQSQRDLPRTLPTEGPDIALVPDQHENCVRELTISMGQSVQEQILKELHKKSQEFKDEAKDNDERNLEDQKIATEENITEVAVTPSTLPIENITNGHPENGEEVLKIVVVEIPIEEETRCENKTYDNEPAVAKANSESEVCQTDSEKPKNCHLHMETTDDEDDRPQRVRRCSSLKTGKTPPGTPGRKKIVRFADVLGLDLADVKTFLDEIPNIPKSAYEDLEILEMDPPIQLGPKSDKLLMPLFQQPGGLPNFLDVVREKLVSLENAAISDAINQTITGSVRVRNLDFHKSVHIRYSLDGWRSFADLQANYVENSCDGFSDKFSFILFGNSLHIGQRLEFAVRFQCKGQQYWDNNYGANYCFQCLPSVAPNINTITSILPSHHSHSMAALLSPTVGESWCTSFY